MEPRSCRTRVVRRPPCGPSSMARSCTPCRASRAEMRAIVTESVLPDLLRRAGGAADVRTTTLRIAVRGESEVATLVAPRRPTPPGLRVAYLASPGDVRLRVTGPRGSGGAVRRNLRGPAWRPGVRRGRTTRSTSSVHRLLAERGATVSGAESLTGGQLGQTLTAMPGSSATFVGGMVAYAAGLKTSLLGVDAGVLDREGPVHPEVAQQMAEGVRARLGTTYGLATTGVAGPEPADGHDRGYGLCRGGRSGPRGALSTARWNAGSGPYPHCRPRARPAPVGPDRREQRVWITCLQWSVESRPK